MKEVQVVGQFDYVPARNHLTGFVERICLVEVTYEPGFEASKGPVCYFQTTTGKQIGSGQPMLTQCEQPYTLVDIDGRPRLILVASASMGRILLVSLPLMTDPTALFHINAETLEILAQEPLDPPDGVNAFAKAGDIQNLWSLQHILGPKQTQPVLSPDVDKVADRSVDHS